MNSNDLVLEALTLNQNTVEQMVLSKYDLKNHKAYLEFYTLLKAQDKAKNIDIMLQEMSVNIPKFWLNEKYNKELNRSFNMLDFEHGGAYGGELEAYAIEFDYFEKDLPHFSVMDKRLTQLDNISSFPTCLVPTLYAFTDNIQGRESEFKKDEYALNDFYSLFEASALVEIHEAFEIAVQNKQFNGLNLKSPCYLTITEHDCGPAKLVYVIE